MTHHILILSGNLPGLITAYRLIPYGFQLTILGPPSDCPTDASSQHPPASTVSGKLLSSQALKGQNTSLILPGFYHSTWSFLQELGLKLPQTFERVDLEFVTSEARTVTLPKAQWFSTLHPIIRLAFFSGLTVSDRWRMINFLEKKWENYVPPDPHSDTLTVESWLLSARQSALAQKEIWNPLCRLFLGCDASLASLWYFLEVLSRFWLPKSQGPEIFLTSPDLLAHLEQQLRQVLKAKGVKVYTQEAVTHIEANTEGVQAIVLVNGERLTADAYISTLSPPELLRLLPERAPARFSCFSHLAQLHEDSGTILQFTFNAPLLSPRLILNSGLFDWVISQTISTAHHSKTLVTCVNLSNPSSPAHTDEWLQDTAWTHIQHLFNISPEQSFSSCKPEVIQSAYKFFPSLAGLRTFRPLPGTPIPNLFLAGPWTATPLPPSLESTIRSAYSCARAVNEWARASSH